MKKVFLLSLLALVCGSIFAQQVTLTFTGREATTNAYVQLSRIEITDLTQGWTDTLTYPDTVAILTAMTGIEDNSANASFGLAQNNPNPFNGTTDVNLTVTESGPVTMEITDMNGRIVETFQETSLQYGTHQFRLNVAATGIYLLSARQNGKTSSVKMVNNGNGTRTGIEYVGIAETVCTPSLHHVTLKTATRGNITHPFAYGDSMVYKGFVNIAGAEREGESVAQTQIESETIALPVQIDGAPCLGTPTLTDVEGNTYNTVQIGNQCWMKENLRTTMYADSTSIPYGYSGSYNNPYRYYPDSNALLVETHGYLYNWKAAMGSSSSSDSVPSGVQGICPDGWHLPSKAEWIQLADYVKSQAPYVSEGCTGSDDEWYTYCIAKALASTIGWVSDTADYAPGNNPEQNNATGFSALPAGGYVGVGHYSGLGAYAEFWSSTVQETKYSFFIALKADDSSFYRLGINAFVAFPVRCLKD